MKTNKTKRDTTTTSRIPKAMLQKLVAAFIHTEGTVDMKKKERSDDLK